MTLLLKLWFWQPARSTMTLTFFSAAARFWLGLITALTREDIPETVGFRKSGTLTSLTDAENVDLDKGMLLLAEANVEILMIPSGGVGHGKRQKFASKCYNGEEFWWHNDDDDWEDDSLLPTH